MRDRIEQAKIRIERDIENVQGQFKDTLEQRGELTKNLHALVVKFEEEKKQFAEKGKDYEWKMDMENMKHFEESDFIEALDYIGVFEK